MILTSPAFVISMGVTAAYMANLVTLGEKNKTFDRVGKIALHHARLFKFWYFLARLGVPGAKNRAIEESAAIRRSVKVGNRVIIRTINILSARVKAVEKTSDELLDREKNMEVRLNVKQSVRDLSQETGGFVRNMQDKLGRIPSSVTA